MLLPCVGSIPHKTLGGTRSTYFQQRCFVVTLSYFVMTCESKSWSLDFAGKEGTREWSCSLAHLFVFFFSETVIPLSLWRSLLGSGTLLEHGPSTCGSLVGCLWIWRAFESGDGMYGRWAWLKHSLWLYRSTHVLETLQTVIFPNILLARKWLRWLWIWIGFMLSIKAAYQWSLLFIGSDMGFLRRKGGELFTRVMDREACGKFPERWILEWSMSHLHFLRLFSCQWNTHQFFFEY